jgi:hypothetical protein
VVLIFLVNALVWVSNLVLVRQLLNYEANVGAFGGSIQIQEVKACSEKMLKNGSFSEWIWVVKI